MEVIMNGKTVQYSMDFRKERPDIFKILVDPNHKIYFIENTEADDMLVFVSPRDRKMTTIDMETFEKFLRKQNKKLFFNISSLFSGSFDSEDSSEDITECILVDKDVFLKGFASNYTFDEINIVKRRNQYLFYIAAPSEIGTTYDIEILKRKEESLRKNSNLKMNPGDTVFYNAPENNIVIINAFSASLIKLSLEEANLGLEHLTEFPKINKRWRTFVFCDAREFLKICEDKTMRAQECNIFIKNTILYICFIKNFEHFNTITDVSKYLYNNPNADILKRIQEETHAQDFLYLSNGVRKDCIVYRQGNTIKFKTLDELGLEENCSDIISAFPKEDIISIQNLDIDYLLTIKLLKDVEIPPKAIETSKYYAWTTFLSKTLNLVRKDKIENA